MMLLPLKHPNAEIGRMLRHIIVWFRTDPDGFRAKASATADLPALGELIREDFGWGEAGWRKDQHKEAFFLGQLRALREQGDLVAWIRDVFGSDVLTATLRQRLSLVATTFLRLAKYSAETADPSPSTPWAKDLIERMGAHLILAVWNTAHDIPPENVAVLRELSRFRLIAEGKTVWDELNSFPSKERLASLLTGVQQLHVSLHSSGQDMPGILLICRLLAQTLLQTDSFALRSPAYRRLLWNSLDALLWHHVLTGCYWNVFGAACPYRGDIHVLNASTFVISEFGYNVLGVDRRLAIHDHLRKAMLPEAMLYQGRDNYRDHLLHAVSTFLLGFILLTAENSPLPSAVREPWGEDEKKRLRNWFVASLLHDVGYAVDAYVAMNPVIDNVASAHVRSLVEELRSVWRRHINGINIAVKKEANLLSEPKGSSDHGVMSALHARRLLKNIDDAARASDAAPSLWPEPLSKYYDSAVAAMMLHNLVEEPVQVSQQPVAGTLILCDELQEWARPRYSRWELQENIASLIDFQAVRSMRTRKLSECFEIVGADVAGGKAAFDPAQPPVIRIQYADQHENVFEPISLMLHKIYNIERLIDVSSVKLSLEFVFYPLSGSPLSGQGVSEFEILRDYCLLTESDYVSPEVYTPIDPVPAVAPRCVLSKTTSDVHPGIIFDTLRLNLFSFGNPSKRAPLIRKPPSSFERELWEFKRSYCRKKGIPCSYLQGEDDWAIRQL